MSTPPHFTASPVPEVMSSGPVTGLVREKQTPKAAATTAKAAAGHDKATYTVTEMADGFAITNRTPLKAAATPSKCVTTPAENAANVTNNGNIPATATTCSTKAPNAPVRANPPESAPVKAALLAKTIAPSTPSAGPVAKLTAGGSGVPVHTDKTRRMDIASSNLTPVNRKRAREAETSGASEAIAKKKTGKESSSITSSATTKQGQRDSSQAIGNVPTSKTGINRVKKATSKSSSSPTKPATKRAKRGHTFKSRRGPSFKAAEALEASNNDVPLEFSTTCYYVQLGESGQPFFIHEAALSRSRKLLDEVEKAKGKLCKTQQQIIQLLPHDAGAFSQMVNFLYSGQFKPLECNKGPKMIGHRMKELHEVMSLAKYYDVPGLQKDIMRVISKDRLVHKVNPAAFFDWAEDMWHEEMDRKNGSFAMYFRRFAPDMLQKASEQDLKGMKFTGQGGDYLKELFMALHKSMSMAGGPSIKLEFGTVQNQRFSQGPMSPGADVFRG